MPIDPNEFNNGKTHNSWEEIVYQILGDGKAYSLDELAKEVGIISPEINKSKKQPSYVQYIKLTQYSLDRLRFELTLNNMEENGIIISKYVNLAGGKSEIYYMRKDLLK